MCGVQASTEGESGSNSNNLREERTYVGDDNCYNGSEKYRVAAHERQKPWCATNGGELVDLVQKNDVFTWKVSSMDTAPSLR